jgi:hypothetical protein
MLMGTCELLPGKSPEFRITLRNDLSEDLAVHTLIHEWAHALSWGCNDWDEDHGPTWGLALGKIWSVIYDEE